MYYKISIVEKNQKFGTLNLFLVVLKIIKNMTYYLPSLKDLTR